MLNRGNDGASYVLRIKHQERQKKLGNAFPVDDSGHLCWLIIHQSSIAINYVKDQTDVVLLQIMAMEPFYCTCY